MKQALLFFSFFLISFQSYAQIPHPPCPPPGVTTYGSGLNCELLCSNCDVETYSGTTPLTIDLSHWQPQCGVIADFVIMGFVAGTDFITITVTPSNCLHGDGVQMTMHSVCSEPFVCCDVGSPGGGNTPIDCALAVTPGQYYSIAIGGYAGDQCDFIVEISPPGGAIAPVPGDIPGDIEGPSILCPGGTATYTVPPAPNAGGYIWTAPPGWYINGFGSPSTFVGLEAASVEITVGPNPGSGQICAQAFNSCFPTGGDMVCKTIEIVAIPPTQLLPDGICAENLPYTLPWGDLAYNSGTYTGAIDSHFGCDSVLILPLTVYDNYTIQLGPKTICEGDILSVCGQDFSDVGFYSASCSSYHGCDSTVFFNVIHATSPVAQINGGGTLDCATNSIVLTAESSLFGTFFTWRNAAGQLLGSANSYTVTMPGTYFLSATLTTNGAQCVRTDSIVITSNLNPPSVTGINGILTCSADSLPLMASSNALTPDWSWAGPGGFLSTAANPIITIPGTYTVTVTSAGNALCTASATLSVTEDIASPTLTTNTATLTCRDTMVQISANSVPNSVDFQWVGPNGFMSSLQNPSVSVAGDYIVTGTNNLNGCATGDTVTVSLNNLSPGATALGGTVNCSTPNLDLVGGSPTNTVNYAWTGPNNFTSILQNPIVSDSGSYTLTVTDTINGCTSSITAAVLADQSAPVVSATSGTLTCSVDSVTLNGDATLPSTYAWTGPNSFSSLQQNPTVNAAGDYTLTATAQNGCTSTTTVTVNADMAAPGASALGDTIDCNNPQVGISVNSSMGISYTWTGPNNFGSTLQNPTVAIEGQYIVRVEGANGCISTDTATVVLNTASPNLQIAAPDLLTCATTTFNLETTIITATSAVQSLTWTGPNGFVSTLEDPAVSESGLYILTATTLNGCSSTAEVTVNQDIILPSISTQGGTLNCAISSITLDGGSATQGATFSWTGPNGFVSTMEDPTIVENGTYNLSVTGLNGCVSTEDAIVLLDTLAPDLAAVFSNNLDCDDLSTTITGSSQTSGVNYIWTGPNNFTANTASTTTATPGTYQVLVTAPNGCLSIDSVVIMQDIAQPGASAQGDTIDCISGQASLTGGSTTAGVVYNWVGPNNFMSSLQNLNVSQSGVYTLIVTGTNGCQRTATASIEENTQSPEVVVSGGGVLTCDIQNLDITAMIVTPGATGIWSGPNNFMSSQASITVSIPGIYTFTVTGPNGCVSSPISTILQDIDLPQGIMISGGELNCSSPSIHLGANSSTPGVLFDWSGPANFGSILPNPEVFNAGVYTLIITDPTNGCSTSATIEVTQDPSVPNIFVAADSLTCAVQTVTLQASTNTSGGTFEWTGPNGFTSLLEDPFATEPGIYSVVISAPDGCSATASFNLLQNINLPGVTAQGGILNCAPPEVQIFSNSTTQGVDFEWVGPNGFLSTTANPTTTFAGSYTVVVTASNGCTSSAIATVIPNTSSPIISATGGTLTCLQPSIMLSGSSNIAVTWWWMGPSGFTSNVQNPATTTGGTYELVATAANGCSATSSILVADQTQAPIVSINQPDELDCTTTQIGLSAQTQGTGNFDYQWETLDGLLLSGVNTPNPQVGQAGTYQVAVTNSNTGCSSTQSVTVLVDAATPSGVLLQAQNISCFGAQDGRLLIEGMQGGTPPFVYRVDNQVFSSNVSYNSLTAGIHTLLVQDANGCDFQTTFEILEPVALTVNLGPDTSIQLGNTVIISLDYPVVIAPSGIEQTLVKPSDLPLDSVFVPTHTLRYQVTVLDSNGCEASDERTIIVERKRHVYIPNVFSPNSAENGTLSIFSGPDVAEIESFQIYDRWGEGVFEQFHFQPNDPTQGWSGQYRGEEVNPGVFVYQVLVRFVDGEREWFTGDITVLR